MTGAVPGGRAARVRVSARRVASLGILLGAAIGAVLVVHHLPLAEPRRVLPSSASDIREWLLSDGFLPDHVYLMRAAMPAEEFASYAQRLGLHHISEVQDPEWLRRLRWGQQDNPSWWTPGPDLSTTMVRTFTNGAIMAKHEYGYVYVMSYAQ